MVVVINDSVLIHDQVYVMGKPTMSYIIKPIFYFYIVAKWKCNFSPDLIDVGSFYCLVSNEVVIEVSKFIVGKKKGGVVLFLICGLEFLL